jgi:CRP-like cAMP-binding protein
VNRDVYSSTAECVVQTTLRKLHKDDLQKILDKDPANGLIFFRHLAGTLGERLVESYSRFEKLFRGETFV